MTKYHLRRQEKEILDKEEMLKIIERNLFFTIALCKDNIPYIVTMNYAFDKKQLCFYFHCANQGKKIGILKSNPSVWGQIIEDKGYLSGQCNHAYISLHFSGIVEFIADIESKQKILSCMVGQFEENPDPVRVKYINKKKLEEVSVGKIIIKELTGKKELP